jgi:DNA polymerase-3 subunit delta'
MARRAAAVSEIEALPEIDRLEGFPHPRDTAELFGH